MRARYLIAYDILDPKRLYRVHKTIASYAVGGQKSFYECWLTKKELQEIQQKLTALIQQNEDKIFIFQLDANTSPILLGCATLPEFNRPFLVI